MDALEKEYSENRVELKKVKKNITRISIVYGLYLFMIVFLLYYSILLGPIFLADAFLVAAASVTGFIGIYKYDERFSKASLAIIIVQFIFNTIIICDDLSDIFTAMLFSFVGYAFVVYCALSAIKSVKKYKWLEQQDGFPNFEPKLAMYDINKRQRDIKDPYAIKKEEIESRNKNSGHMDEL